MCVTLHEVCTARLAALDCEPRLGCSRARSEANSRPSSGPSSQWPYLPLGADSVLSLSHPQAVLSVVPCSKCCICLLQGFPCPNHELLHAIIREPVSKACMEQQ